jgi:hypothetical protein
MEVAQEAVARALMVTAEQGQQVALVRQMVEMAETLHLEQLMQEMLELPLTLCTLDLAVAVVVVEEYQELSSRNQAVLEELAAAAK